MKLSQQSQSHNDCGSLIVSAAITAAVISILIAGMLTFISNEYTLNLRSHRWNQSLAIAESGVELAFAEFNNYYLKGSNAFSSARGWYNNGSGNYYCYVPSFTNAAGESVGSLWAFVNGVGTLNPWVNGYGNCPTTPRGPPIWRRVDCTLSFNSQFPAGLVAKGGIDMKGNNVTTDSYDSSDFSKSDGNGRYDAGKKQANGDVATNNAITNSIISAGNANIYGRALTGPSGNVTLGPQGTIGPTFTSPATTIADAQANGWVRNDFAVDIPDVSLPSGANSWVASGSINSDSTTLSAGDYKVTDITLSASKTLVITGTVRIYVTGDISLTGNGQITVASGGKLTIYTAGAMDIGGNGVVNSGANAASASLYGLPTCTSVDLHGNANWCGVVYAPQADFTLGGGGSSGDMSGALVSKSIKLNGGVTFHYDEALRKSGPNSNFNIASWKSWRYAGASSWTAD